MRTAVFRKPVASAARSRARRDLPSPAEPPPADPDSQIRPIPPQSRNPATSDHFVSSVMNPGAPRSSSSSRPQDQSADLEHSVRRPDRRAGWWKSPRPDPRGPRLGNRPGLLDRFIHSMKRIFISWGAGGSGMKRMGSAVLCRKPLMAGGTGVSPVWKTGTGETPVPPE